MDRKSDFELCAMAAADSLWFAGSYSKLSEVYPNVGAMITLIKHSLEAKL